MDGAAFGRSIQALCQHAYLNRGGSATISQLRLTSASVSLVSSSEVICSPMLCPRLCYHKHYSQQALRFEVHYSQQALRFSDASFAGGADVWFALVDINCIRYAVAWGL